VASAEKRCYLIGKQVRSYAEVIMDELLVTSAIQTIAIRIGALE
jgi:hypothetical protein